MPVEAELRRGGGGAWVGGGGEKERKYGGKTGGKTAPCQFVYLNFF